MNKIRSWKRNRLREMIEGMNKESSKREEIVVNVGYQIVIIDKLYGPTSAELVRIYIDTASWDWVVERQNVATNEWQEKARWPIQESYPNESEELCGPALIKVNAGGIRGEITLDEARGFMDILPPPLPWLNTIKKAYDDRNSQLEDSLETVSEIIREKYKDKE